MSGQDASGQWDGCIRTFEVVTEHFANPNLTGCCEMLVFRFCGVRQNLYVYSLYCNPDLDDRIFYCLLASMAAVQAEDVRTSFLFVGDSNGHHQEWLGSTTANRHGVAAFDFATVSGCDKFVVGPTIHVVEHLTSG